MVVEQQTLVLIGHIVVHRIGGSDLGNLHLKPRETKLEPPGISVLLGGTAEEAAKQITEAYPDQNKFSLLHELAKRVASATVDRIREAGFEVFPDTTKKFPNHARIIHAKGVEGFGEQGLKELAKAFTQVDL